MNFNRCLFLISIFFVFVLYNLPGCSINDPESKYSTVNIDLGLDDNTTKSAKAPQGLENIVLSVSGPGIEAPLEFTIPLSGKLSVEIPPGKSRLFSITADMDPSYPDIINSYTGSASTDLRLGETVSISIDLNIHSSKILIPDSRKYGDQGAIFQVDDMSGVNIIEASYDDLDLSSIEIDQFSPMDLALDSSRRIYIANRLYSSIVGDGCIIRIDHLSAPGSRMIVSPGEFLSYNEEFPLAVAVDKQNEFLYFTTKSSVYLKRLEYDEAPVNLNLTAEEIGELTVMNYSLTGICVDDNSRIYIVNNYEPVIILLDPFADTGSRVIASTKSGKSIGNKAAAFDSLLSRPTDIEFKNDFLYVANSDSTDDNCILVLNSDLSQPAASAGYSGDASDDPAAPFQTFGPKRFLETLNNKIYFIDEERTSINRIASFDTISDSSSDISGWQIYPEDGTGSGVFEFYEDGFQENDTL